MVNRMREFLPYKLLHCQLSGNIKFRNMVLGISMRKTMTAAAVLIGLAGSVAPALAATMLGTSGTPLSEAIKNSHGANADGNLLTFASDPSGFLIDYSSTGILHYNGNSGGFAQVTGPGAGGGTGFADLTITPQSVTFSEFKF